MMKIETRTTGFSSPGADYVDQRLSLCDEITEDPYFTFYFKSGLSIEHLDISKGDILVVTRKRPPIGGDVCVGIKNRSFIVYEFGSGEPDQHWGVIIGIRSRA